MSISLPVSLQLPVKGTAWVRQHSLSASTCSGSCRSRASSFGSAYSTSAFTGPPTPVASPRGPVPTPGLFTGPPTPVTDPPTPVTGPPTPVASPWGHVLQHSRFQVPVAAAGNSMSVCSGATLDVRAGDVLSVTGNDRIARLGAHGGFMGHVLVVLSKAQPLPASSPEGSRICKLLQMRSACLLWKVRTLESTRSKSGLHIADLLLRYDGQSGRLVLVGEVSVDGAELSMIESEAVEVWQSPPELRNILRFDLIERVVADMKEQEANWSLATAARALLTGFNKSLNSSNRSSLKEIQDSWDMAPICTSVVIVFWQRYLIRLAKESEFQSGRGQPSQLILRWMPLKSDGVLPGVLIKVMCDCGWVRQKNPIL